MVHGMSDTRLYRVWSGMKDRCYNKNCKGYKNYGGRGITVCPEWKHDFMAFYEWAVATGYDENAPRGMYTIERKENDGPYNPDNCRWATIREQEGNKQTTLRVTVDGENIRLAELAEREGVKYNTALKRFSRRKQGVIPREEYLEKTQEEKQLRLEAAREVLVKNPNLSERALAKELGISRTSAQRIKKLLAEKTE